VWRGVGGEGRAAAWLGIVLVLTSASASAAEDARRKIAVLGLKGGPGIQQSVADVITETLVAGIQTRPGLKVISTQDIETALRFEQKKQLLGCADSAQCLAEIGGSLGVEWIVSGTLAKIGSSVVFNAQVVDIRTGAVVQRYSSRLKGGTEESFLDAAEEAVAKLFPAPDAPAAKPAVAVAAPTPPPAPAPAPPKAEEPKPVVAAAETPPAQPTPRRWSVAAGGSALVLTGSSAPTGLPDRWGGAWFAGIAATAAPWLEVRARIDVTPRSSARYGGALGVRAAPFDPAARVRPYLCLDAEGSLSSAGSAVGIAPGLGLAWSPTERFALSVEARAVWLLAAPAGMNRAYLFVAPALEFRP